MAASRCVLVPQAFFSPEKAREALADVVPLREEETVGHVEVPRYAATLIYSPAADLPEMFYVLEDLGRCREHNKVVASYADGRLDLAVAEGEDLKLCNSFEAPDFTTAEYFIFLVLRRLQLNPEVSTIVFRTPLSQEEEMSLYRYFKAVERP